VAEFHTARSLQRREGFRQLGPSALAETFDEETAIANLASRPGMELGLALLDQRLMAGVGNFFKSEVAFACGVNPFRTVGTLSRSQLEELVASSRKLLQNRPEPFVYGRTGQPCRRCGTPIRSAKHRADGRVSFWCPQCQT
jgi:endonuclease-8